MSPRPSPSKSNPQSSGPEPNMAAGLPSPPEPTISPVPRPSARARPKYPPKVSFYQDPADTDRMRAALLHTLVTEGSRSLSQFIHSAVMTEVERLERKYNNGKPFPPVGVRKLPQGRPMKE